MANFNFLDLTSSVREKMIAEIDYDISRTKLYISNRLSEDGKVKYKEILKSAVTKGNDSTFASELAKLMNHNEIRNGKSRKVPKNAANILAQSEFNRFYIRGVCLEAIEKNIPHVIIYRGRESSWARYESEMKIGMELLPHELLEDLRQNIGAEPDILPEINSGLTVKIS